MCACMCGYTSYALGSVKYLWVPVVVFTHKNRDTSTVKGHLSFSLLLPKCYFTHLTWRINSCTVWFLAQFGPHSNPVSPLLNCMRVDACQCTVRRTACGMYELI